jgi:putative flavoprotein involved in K+ transport
VKPKDLIDAGIQHVGRVTGVQDGKPLLEDGGTIDVRNVIWCTGYEPGFSWIDLPAFDKECRPAHERGISKVPGLYFVGLHFQYAMSSATLIGVGRDAEYVVKAVVARSRWAKRAPEKVRAMPLPVSADPVGANLAREA